MTLQSIEAELDQANAKIRDAFVSDSASLLAAMKLYDDLHDFTPQQMRAMNDTQLATVAILAAQKLVEIITSVGQRIGEAK